MKLKEIVRVVAPTLAQALGGPLLGTAVRALSDKFLGKPNGTIEEVEAVLSSATPAQLFALKELDISFKKEMVAAGLKLEELEVEDRDSARKMFMAVRDPTPMLLTFAIIGVWAVVQYMLFTSSLPEGSRDLIARMLGTLDAALLALMNFWFGSSRSSREKNETISRLAS